jgi:hypothetical protein
MPTEEEWRDGLLARAQIAAGDAAFEDWSNYTVDEEILDAVQKAADAI